MNGGGREDVTSDGQDFAREFDGLGEIAGHLGQCRDEEVAKAVAAEFSSGAKPMAKKSREHLFVSGQSDQAVAQIARRQ